ncbi:MAG: alpha/beta hydrolase domain-containing protein [Gemmatimonadota bacterium]|nr:alpha/beta hydrolase domain-containing protein [Gemmatimonadota bacterium]
MTRTIGTLLTLLCLAVSAADAEVIRIEVRLRADLAGGMSFGLAGPYEKLIGTIYFAVDPDNPANQIITDIALAPRNADGLVEFHSDFFLIKPKDVEHGNGTVLYEVSNRGGKGMLRYFNRGAGSVNPQTVEEMGDGLLFRNGFTLLWLGWQFDPPERDGLVRLYTPIATDGGTAIEGLVRSEVIVQEREFDRSLADRNHIAYPVTDPSDPVNVMTVRDAVDGQRRVIPRDQWQFARLENGQIVEDLTRAYLEGGFEPHKIYDIIYKAQDPPVIGLGPAAIRDVMARLKYGAADELSIPAGAIDRALAFGISQSGRFLRTFLFYGFNETEGHRKAFDGVISHVAGGGRGSFNHRFAQASRDGHPYLNKLYPTDIFPFTDVEQTDPETEMRDGLLARVAPAFMPKIFYTNSSYEYWGRAASLIHTSIDGTQDSPLMENVRIYSFAGGQHGPGSFPAEQRSGQQLSNPNDYSWFMRGLLLAMNHWTDDGSLPPDSRYPLISDGDLVLPEQLNFPQLPGVGRPGAPHKAYRVDYGPEFATRGIVSFEPPEVASAFPIMVPQVDDDGNETGGLKMPGVEVPLATYTGWNLFQPEFGPEGVLSSMQGSYIPFPRTAVDRQESDDPRGAIAERYRTREQYVGLVSNVALRLIDEGYLLAEDLAPILGRASEHWDYLMQPGATQP